MNNEFDFINSFKIESKSSRKVSETSKIDSNDENISSSSKIKMNSLTKIELKDHTKIFNSSKIGESEHSISNLQEFTKLQPLHGNLPKQKENMNFRNSTDVYQEERKNSEDPGGNRMDHGNTTNSLWVNLKESSGNEIKSEIEEVESFDAPAEVKANSVSKESFIKSMGDIKQLILGRNHKPETRINLMNTVMHELRRVTDPKSKQEITELFNENDLILHFIKSFLRMVIQEKIEAKFEYLKNLDYNRTFKDKFQCTNWGDDQIDQSFVDYFKKESTAECDNSQIFMAIYWAEAGKLSEFENENWRKIIDLLLSLMQNNPEGVHDFIINDIKSSKTWSIYHSLTYMFLNSDSDELQLSIWIFLKTVIKPQYYSSNSSLASRYLFERIISYHFINYLVFIRISLQTQPEKNTIPRYVSVNSYLKFLTFLTVKISNP